jgi:hypothetical protein
MTNYRVIKPVLDKEYLNKYFCEKCEHTWHDVWDSACDDECPMCGDNIMVGSSSPLSDNAIEDDYLIDLMFRSGEFEQSFSVVMKVGRGEHVNHVVESYLWNYYGDPAVNDARKCDEWFYYQGDQVGIKYVSFTMITDIEQLIDRISV